MNRILFTLICFGFFHFAEADEVMLMDSTTYQGEILKLAPCQLKIKTGSETYTFQADDVALIWFQNPYNRKLKKYRKNLEQGRTSCFYVMNLHHRSAKDEEERLSTLYGPQFKFKSGGEVAVHTIDRSTDPETEEGAGIWYQQQQNNKGQVWKVLLLGLLLGSVISF